MAWSLVEVNSAAEVSSVETVTVAEQSLHLELGDIICGGAFWNGGSTTVGIASTVPNNALTMFDVVSGPTGRKFGAIGWGVVTTHDEASVMRVTFGAARDYVALIVMQFRPTAGNTVSLVAGPSSGNGNSAAVLSGNISPNGSELLVFAGASHRETGFGGTMQIADATPDGTTALFAYGTACYSFFGSNQSNIHSQATAGDIENWVIDILALNSAAAGGTEVDVAAGLEQAVAVQETPTVSAIQSLFDVRKHVKMIF